MADKRTAAIRAMERAIREIAAINDYPPPPGHYADIQRTWKRMVTKARRVVAQLDALTEDDL